MNDITRETLRCFVPDYRELAPPPKLVREILAQTFEDSGEMTWQIRSMINELRSDALAAEIESYIAGLLGYC